MAAEVATQMLWHVARQAADNATEPSPEQPADPGTPACDVGNDYDGRIGVRVSAIFVILLGSFLGTWFPVFAARRRGMGVPDMAFFIAKFFGSGIIIATAFIHLLAPANDALTDPCLTGPITEYDWVEGIALMMVFALFFVELMVMRYGKFGAGHSHGGPGDAESHTDTYSDDEPKNAAASPPEPITSPHLPGEDHLGHAREHVDNDDIPEYAAKSGMMAESYSAQLTALFILEFGVVFHSVFIGLTLAVAGKEFTVLYIVLVFHQSFEGLALGTRLATVPWPKSKRWTPYILGAGYAISTPIAIAVGLAVRSTFQPGSQRTLIVNGVFDSISAGILLYTGLVELMAHEFIFSPYMSRAPIKTVLGAFGWMTLGAGLMALLGKWA